MHNLVFYGHAGSNNHGCEAIVRSSVNILGNDQVILYSYNPEQDIKYGLGSVVGKIEKDPDSCFSKCNWRTVLAKIQYKLTGKIDLLIRNRKWMLLNQVKRNDLWFSIGGDNYCYPGVDILSAENRLIRKKGGKNILWGCSVEPNILKNKETIRDIAGFDLITARESISYEALKVLNKNVYLVPDPAFTLEKEELQLPKQWNNGNMVGINASPLILHSGMNPDLVKKAYVELVNYILKKTSFGIALIPHVTSKNNNDSEILSDIYSFFKSDRIVLIEDCNCMQLKGYIARCRFFIGARTHSTIAAYSSCVPTVVLGYSIKSRGIARDIFGTEINYVLRVQDMKDDQELKDAFVWLCNHEEQIKSHLQRFMPDYIKKAYLGKTLIGDLVKGE